MTFKDFFTTSGPINPDFKIGGLPYILWLAVPLVLITILSFFFAKYKKAGKITVYVLAAIMLVLRIVKYAYLKPSVWNETWKSIIPFELCTIMSWLLPITVFFKLKKLTPFIYPLAIFGGLLTLAYPEWIYNGYGLNFNKLESLIVHILLIAIPYFSHASNFNFKFKLKDYYKPVIAMVILVGYAYLANTYITPGTNHMFIAQNPLPINFGSFPYQIALGAAFLIALLLFYLPFAFKGRKQ